MAINNPDSQRSAISRLIGGAVALALVGAGSLRAEPPQPEPGIVVISDLPADQSPSPAEADTRIELPESSSRIAEAFLLRRDQEQPKPSKQKPHIKQPTWFDPAEEARAMPVAPHRVDSDVKPAHRIEPARPTTSRAMALLVVARQLAVEARTVGDFTGVIDQCHRALDAHPDRQTGEALARLGAWAYNRRGEQLVRSNERAAFDDFQEAILLDPSCWEALHNRGITLARYHKFELALADFTQVIELESSFYLARFNRAETHAQMSQWEEAIIDYTATLKGMPEEPLAYAGRAQAHHQLGHHREAMQDFNRALAIDGGCERALVGRAMVQADQGEFAQATADFRLALKVGNPTATTYRSVGWFLATCPDSEFRDATKGIEAARRALSLSGDNDPASLNVLAAAYASAGQFAQAVEYQEQAVSLASASEKEAYEARLEFYRQGRPSYAE